MLGARPFRLLSHKTDQLGHEPFSKVVPERRERVGDAHLPTHRRDHLSRAGVGSQPGRDHEGGACELM